MENTDYTNWDLDKTWREIWRIDRKIANNKRFRRKLVKRIKKLENEKNTSIAQKLSTWWSAFLQNTSLARNTHNNYFYLICFVTIYILFHPVIWTLILLLTATVITIFQLK